jgi:hypothetical protein
MRDLLLTESEYSAWRISMRTGNARFSAEAGVRAGGAVRAAGVSAGGGERSVSLALYGVPGCVCAGAGEDGSAKVVAWSRMSANWPSSRSPSRCPPRQAAHRGWAMAGWRSRASRSGASTA